MIKISSDTLEAGIGLVKGIFRMLLNRHKHPSEISMLGSHAKCVNTGFGGKQRSLLTGQSLTIRFRPVRCDLSSSPVSHLLPFQCLPHQFRIFGVQADELRLANIHRLRRPVRRFDEHERQANRLDLERRSRIGGSKLHVDRFVAGNARITTPKERRELIHHVQRGDVVSTVQIFRSDQGRQSR